MCQLSLFISNKVIYVAVTEVLCRVTGYLSGNRLYALAISHHPAAVQSVSPFPNPPSLPGFAREARSYLRVVFTLFLDSL